MKTFQVVEPKKMVTWSLVVMFSFLQIMPTGWAAARPADELQARGVSASVGALANSAVAQKPVPAPQQTGGFFDSTAFQLNENPLSSATTDSIESTVPPVQKLPNPEVLPVDPNKISYTPPIVIDVTKVPAPVQIVTDPNTGKEISVSINDRGIATVKWGDQEYKGYFDARTNSVILITNDDSIWTLQFANREDGSLYLQSFHTSFWSSERSSDETYTFNAQSQLIRKDWNNDNSGTSCFEDPYGGTICSFNRGGKSGGTIDYVAINGKTLVSHGKTWDENGGWIFKTYNLARTDDSAVKSDLIYPYRGNRSETESWYSYDNQGNLMAKSWSTSDSYGNSSFGQEQYVQVNGKTLLSVSRMWQYCAPIRKYDVDPGYTNLSEREIVSVDDFQPIKIPIGVDRILSLFVSSHTETYYSYDSQGNLASEVSATEGYDSNNIRHTSGHYWLRDAAKNAWTFASADGIDPFSVWFRHDLSVITAAAWRMTVYVGGNGDRYSFTHRVEFAHNAAGVMTPKAVYDNAGNVSIVQGEPDVLSGETNDITLRNFQEVGGYHVYYGEYSHDGVNNDGYRLVFIDSNWNIVTGVDYPAKTTVILNGVENKITIDKNGILTLQEVPSVIPPAVQAYVNQLQQLMGSVYKVGALLQADGRYTVTVNFKTREDCTPGGACPMVIFIPKPGQLTHMNFMISEDGVADISTLQVLFPLESGIKTLPGDVQAFYKVDAQLLYDGVWKVLEQEGTVCNQEVCTVKLVLPKDILTGMTRITVTGVDDAIHFTKDSVGYKCYRNAEGKVVLEKELTPSEKAIAAVKAALAKTTGLTAEALDALIESISFESGAVSVIFKAGNMGEGRLIDVLGSGKLSTSAVFTVSEDGKVLSAVMTWKKSETVSRQAVLSYNAEEQISEIEWSESISDPLRTATLLIGKDVYTYSDGAVSIKRYLAISLVDDPTNGLLRETLLQLKADGKYHVSEVKQYANGQLVERSRFDYLIGVTLNLCLEGTVCPPTSSTVDLFRIVRTDAKGNPLSVISSLFENGGVITLPNGTSKPGVSKDVTFNSLEELLDLARQFEQAHAAVIAAVKADLAKMLGLSAEVLDTLIASIITDETGRVSVMFKSGDMGDSRLIAVLGNGKVPTSVVYTLGADGKIVSSIIRWQESSTLVLKATVSYAADGLISEIEWVRENIPDLQGPLTALLGKDVYAYADKTISIKHYSAAVWIEDPTDGLLQEISLTKREDGKFHAAEVKKYVNGQLLDVSKFMYIVGMTVAMCTPEGKCTPPVYDVRLANIVRTDANGKALSETVINGHNALITLSDGQVKEAVFLTLEELIGEARAFEAASYIPPSVEEYVDALKGQLGNSFSVTVKRQEDGTYLVRVGTVLPPCAEGAICDVVLIQGGFSSMEYSLNKEGLLNRDSVKAYYNGMTVDGKFLLEAMGALVASFHPAGTDWMMAPPYYYARLVTLMTQIVVKEADSKLLRFDHNGTSYKAYRDSNGQVIVVKENPVKPGIPGLPDNELAAYIDAVAAHFRISVEDIVSIQKYEAMTVCLGTGCPAWALDVELTAMVNGKKTILKGVVEGPAWDGVIPRVPRQIPAKSLAAEAEPVAADGAVYSLAPLSFSVRFPSMAYRSLTGRTGIYSSAGSLPSIGAMLRGSAVNSGIEGFGTSAIFGFELGSILFSTLLTELTK